MVYIWVDGTIRLALIFGGADYEATFEYYEGMFDDMSVRDMAMLDDFFPDLDEWLYYESMGYIDPRVSKLLKNVDMISEDDMEDILKIQEAWKENRETFETKFKKINQQLVDAFQYLNDRYLELDDFIDFLETIAIENDGSKATVSSPYGTLTYTRIRERRHNHISRHIYRRLD